MSGAVEGAVLLPCPFCGGTETGLYRPTEARTSSSWHDWFVRCHQCHVESAEYETEAEAITAWNTRTAPPARTYAEGVRALQQACEAYVAAYDAGTGTIHVNKQIRAALATSRSQHEGAGR